MTYLIIAAIRVWIGILKALTIAKSSQDASKTNSVLVLVRVTWAKINEQAKLK